MPISLNSKGTEYLKSLWKKGDSEYPQKEYYGWIDVKKKAHIHLHNTFKLDEDGDICRPAFNGLNFPGQIIFHVHPTHEDHKFEFPSTNDIFNFMFLHNHRRLKQSIVIAKEGFYSIRSLKRSDFEISKEMYDKIDQIVESVFNMKHDHKYLLKFLNSKLQGVHIYFNSDRINLL
jgi:hypothetical protein